MTQLPPSNGDIRRLPYWAEKLPEPGKPWVVNNWVSQPFTSDMDSLAESPPPGIAVVVGNSHNSVPRQTIQLILRDAPFGFRPLEYPFSKIEGSYAPIGHAHAFIHRDYEWQEPMLKIISGSGQGLPRIYTWWYVTWADFKFVQPVPGGESHWEKQ